MSQIFRLGSHRGMAPVIATLLLVGITVAGGSVTYSYAQGIINNNQITEGIQIESLVILGHDSRDVSELRSHTGYNMEKDSAGIPDGLKSNSERITIYIENRGIKNSIIDELRFAGDIYEFSGSSNYMGNFVTNTSPAPGEYVILTTRPNIIINSDYAELPAGKVVSLVLGLDSGFKIGRHVMLKLTTDNDFLVAKTIAIGSYYDVNDLGCIAKEQEGGEGGSEESCSNSESGSGGGSESGSGTKGSGTKGSGTKGSGTKG